MWHECMTGNIIKISQGNIVQWFQWAIPDSFFFYLRYIQAIFTFKRIEY